MDNLYNMNNTIDSKNGVISGAQPVGQTQPTQSTQPAQPSAGQNVSGFDSISDMPDMTPVRPLNSYSFTKCDVICAWAALILGFVFTRYAVRFYGGIWGGIFWAAVGALGACFVGVKKIRTSPAQKAVFAVAELFCLVPLFSANGAVNFLAAVYSFLLMFYLSIVISGAELFGKHFVMDMFLSVLVRPFESYSACPKAAGTVFQKGKASKNVLYGVVGLIIALPLTLVVVVLLMMSDGAFEGIMDGFLGSLPEFSFGLILQIAFAIPIGFYLFGMIFSAGKPVRPRSTEAPQYRFLPPAAAYVAVTPICVFYLVYIITQLGYLSAAFGGELPEGYSFSEFARRGFFELCVVAVIDLCVIAAMQAFVKRGENDRRPAALRLYTVIISVFTLLLIACAMSKMALYINEFGMTQLRVCTSWFMAVLAAAFIIITIWQFKDFGMWKVMFAAFTVMFGVLCFGNVDGNIARYNVRAYESGALEELDVNALYELGIAGTEPAAELLESGTADKTVERDLREFLAFELATYYKGFEYFSIPRETAVSAIHEAGINEDNMSEYTPAARHETVF